VVLIGPLNTSPSRSRRGFEAQVISNGAERDGPTATFDIHPKVWHSSSFFGKAVLTELSKQSIYPHPLIEHDGLIESG
jgi:hypothetical protein